MTMAAVPLEPPPFEHRTVMPGEVLFALDPVPGGLYVDCTVGAGGHAAALLAHEPRVTVIGLDRDPAAIDAARSRLAPHGHRARLERARFSELGAVLERLGVDRVDGVVADLGVSSPQLDDAGRGMSFRTSGPLDMRMDPDEGETARELVERLDQDDLADVIYQLGEERRSRRVAACIKQALDAGELETTLDLRRAVVRAVGPRRVGGVDPATRTFQALRMAVNRELDELSELLRVLPSLLGPRGTAVFISFHSLEDRLVKRAFLQREVWRRLTKRPLSPRDDERAHNPRSRSAKLRAARLLGADEEQSPLPPDGEEQ